MSVNRRIIPRCYLSLTTWFYHPDIDMKSWEILSRGSATLIIPPTLPLSHASSLSSYPSLSSKSHPPAAKSSSQRLLYPASSSSSPSVTELPWQLLASYHVTHPYHFPQYYPVERYPWLDILTASNLRYTVEVREDTTGSILRQFTLPYTTTSHQRSTHQSTKLPMPMDTRSSSYEGLIGHPGGRDVSAINLSPSFVSDHFLQFFAPLPPPQGVTISSTSYSYQLQPLQLSTTNISETSSVAFHGHFLRSRLTNSSSLAVHPSISSTSSTSTYKDNIDKNTTEDQNDKQILLSLSHQEDQGSYLQPRSIPGRVIVRSSHQIFARTKEVLEMGMCGGPVTLDIVGGIASSSNNNDEAALTTTNSNNSTSHLHAIPSSNLCYGIIEGIVPVNESSPEETDEKDTTVQPSSSTTHNSSTLHNIKKLLSGCSVFIEADTLYNFCYNLYTEGQQYNQYKRRTQRDE